MDTVEVVVDAEIDAAEAERLRNQAVDDRKDLVGKIRGKITQGRKHDEEARKRYASDRLVAAGETQWLVDTNLVGAIMEILMAFVYAKDPDINVTVSDSVGQSRSRELADVTETLQIVVSRMLKDAGLKRKAKRWVRSAMTVGVGWLKLAMQTRTEKDPLIMREINDLQDNIASIANDRANLAYGECEDEGVIRARLEEKMKALEDRLEREIAIGLAIDFFAAEDVQVSPECGELENYLDAPWINFRFYKSKDDAQTITGWSKEDLKNATIYHQRPRQPNEGTGQVSTGGSSGMEWVTADDMNAESVEGFVVIDEFHSKVDGLIYTLVDGVDDKFGREPYAPRQSSRFYDTFMLAFHHIDGVRHPQSDVHQLKRLQDEYGRTRSNFAEHRKRSIPSTIVDGSQIPPDEMEKIRKSETGEWTVINQTNPGDDIRKAFAPKAYAQFDPNLYNTQPILTDIEKVSGAQDAMQANVAVAKTATEAEIQNSGFGARIGTRKDAVEDVLNEIALHTAQLSLQTLTPEFVVRIAGSSAVWPQLSVDEVMYAFDIEVKAGSTGKPNTQAQRAAWSNLLPMIEKIITVVGNFRAQGPQMEWAARPYIELLRETVNRLDDKFDIERLLPTPPPPEPPNPMDALLAAAGGGGEPAAPPMVPTLGGDNGGSAPLPSEAPVTT